MRLVMRRFLSVTFPSASRDGALPGAALISRRPASQRSLMTETHGRLPSVGVLGLPCFDLRILCGLLRCPVQLALLDALELLHLVLPVQRVQVLPALDLSDLQTHAAAGSQRPSSAQSARLCVTLCDFVSVWPYASVGAPSS